MSYRLHSDRMKNNLKELDEANVLVEDALKKINENICMLESKDLDGNRIKALYSLHKIMSQHHGKLLQIFKDDTEGMRGLLNEANNYLENGEIPSEWK